MEAGEGRGGGPASRGGVPSNRPPHAGGRPVPPTETRFPSRKIDLSTARDLSKGISRLFFKKKEKKGKERTGQRHAVRAASEDRPRG